MVGLSHISNTNSPPRMMSAWRIVKPSSGLPFSVTDFTYLFSRERLRATTLNSPLSTFNFAQATCGAPMTYSPPHGLNG